MAIGRQCVDLFLLTTPSAKTVFQHVFIYFCTDKKIKETSYDKDVLLLQWDLLLHLCHLLFFTNGLSFTDLPWS